MVIYVSRLMKGQEVLVACNEFREREARNRRIKIRVVNTKKATLCRA